MQTIIKFLANGGEVHVSFVTFLHFLRERNVDSQCGQTNQDSSRTVKIATEANLRFFYYQKMS